MMVFNTLGVISNVVSPFLLNPTAANLKGKAAWLSAGFNGVILIWMYFRLPETKGRSNSELDWIFGG